MEMSDEAGTERLNGNETDDVTGYYMISNFLFGGNDIKLLVAGDLATLF